MDLNIIANSLNNDCLSDIYSFIDRKQLCCDILIKKKEEVFTQAILTPIYKDFCVKKYYYDEVNGVVYFIEKKTNCYIHVTEYFSALYHNNINHYKKKN